jgi:ribosomal protein S8
MNSYTNISIFGYDLIVQKLKKPFEVRVAIKNEGEVKEHTLPSNESLEKILYYLSEEGFLDDCGMDSNEITWLEGEPKMRLAVGYLPSHKFKQLKYKLEQHG